jgi:hypothetical protein
MMPDVKRIPHTTTVNISARNTSRKLMVHMPGLVGIIEQMCKVGFGSKTDFAILELKTAKARDAIRARPL